MDFRWLSQIWYRVANCKFSPLFTHSHIFMNIYSAKYPLACVSKLLDVFGEDLGGGFDIGCKFKTTLANSPLGPRACELCHTCLVGAFHGHAHNRLCQLQHLAVYVKGWDLRTSRDVSVHFPSPTLSPPHYGMPASSIASKLLRHTSSTTIHSRSTKT